MNIWLAAAAALTAALVPCLAVGLRRGAKGGLIAMELAGTLAASVLMVLSQAYAREPFLDLAIVTAVLSNLGAIAAARLMEGEW